jgi:hypothetical protein
MRWCSWHVLCCWWCLTTSCVLLVYLGKFLLDLGGFLPSVHRDLCVQFVHSNCTGWGISIGRNSSFHQFPGTRHGGTMAEHALSSRHWNWICGVSSDASWKHEPELYARSISAAIQRKEKCTESTFPSDLLFIVFSCPYRSKASWPGPRWVWPRKWAGCF